jgi:hypothetical protein
LSGAFLTASISMFFKARSATAQRCSEQVPFIPCTFHVLLN